MTKQTRHAPAFSHLVPRHEGLCRLCMQNVVTVEQALLACSNLRVQHLCNEFLSNIAQEKPELARKLEKLGYISILVTLLETRTWWVSSQGLLPGFAVV
jgi:hypothetical protein